jgi:hypothetical protein
MEDTHVDTIDLTLSSPEPEQRRQLPPQQQYLPPHLKKEPGSDFGDRAQVKRERGVNGPRPHKSRSHTQPINPQHLARMMDTTEPRVIKSVLLELCKLSPALSGAVARGIAPHSMFAQGLIRQRQANLRAAAARSVKQEDSSVNDAYERTKRRLATQMSVGGPSQARVRPPSSFPSARGMQVADGSQSVPRVKLERRFGTAESDSDLDQYVPDEFPVSSQRPKTERLPLRHVSNSDFANHTSRPTSLSDRLIHAQGSSGPRTATKTCKQCHNFVEDEAGLCFYHPNPEFKANGEERCRKCDEPWKEEGCEIGMHVVENDTNLDPLKRNQQSRLHSPSKRHRVL